MWRNVWENRPPTHEPHLSRFALFHLDWIPRNPRLLSTNTWIYHTHQRRKQPNGFPPNNHKRGRTRLFTGWVGKCFNDLSCIRPLFFVLQLFTLLTYSKGLSEARDVIHTAVWMESLTVFKSRSDEQYRNAVSDTLRVWWVERKKEVEHTTHPYDMYHYFYIISHVYIILYNLRDWKDCILTLISYICIPCHPSACDGRRTSSRGKYDEHCWGSPGETVLLDRRRG